MLLPICPAQLVAFGNMQSNSGARSRGEGVAMGRAGEDSDPQEEQDGGGCESLCPGASVSRRVLVLAWSSLETQLDTGNLTQVIKEL